MAMKEKSEIIWSILTLDYFKSVLQHIIRGTKKITEA